MKYEKEYGALLKHSHLLRASLNLAHDRRQQLQSPHFPYQPYKVCRNQ